MSEKHPTYAFDPAGQVTGNFRLTPPIYERTLNLIRIGNYQGVAAQACGISPGTLTRYKKLGREFHLRLVELYGDEYEGYPGHEPDDAYPCPRGPHPLTTKCPNPLADEGYTANQWTCWRWFLDCAAAEAEGEAYAVGVVHKAMDGNWQAAMAFLERKAPDRWRRRDLHEVQVQQHVAEDDAGLLGEAAQAHISEALRAASRGELPPGDDQE